MTREVIEIAANDLKVGDRIVWRFNPALDPADYTFEIVELSPPSFASPPGYRLVPGSLVANVIWKDGRRETRIWHPEMRGTLIYVARPEKVAA